ncbi:glutathione S-transferase [Acrasis kona]|uniref:Glutathione S-transferase n=1 Tax=Acrasis kona TaxID=1008807 RepID=A0AAW2ZAE5_9EUKA
MSGKQITLWTHVGGPNGWKVNALLRELNVSFESKYVEFSNKDPEFLKVQPNGRIPVIIDHNRNDKVLWESVAILLYLVHHYDKDNKLWFTNEDEISDAHQWLLFQASGVGPYFGQKAWFSNFHSEKLPSAIERYEKEINRVLGVFEKVLDGKEWLVGNKYSIVDINNYVWLVMVPWLSGQETLDKYPNVKAYIGRIGEQKGVKEAYAEKNSLQKH